MKALEILKEGLDFMEKAIKVNPMSENELNSEIKIYKEAIEELEALENKSCRNCKHCSDDCDEDGEFYCNERFKHVELDFCCKNKWECKK